MYAQLLNVQAGQGVHDLHSRASLAWVHKLHRIVRIDQRCTRTIVDDHYPSDYDVSPTITSAINLSHEEKWSAFNYQKKKKALSDCFENYTSTSLKT